MKARLLRFLVEEMGFDTFAIEATWPEALRLDRYVRTGEGDAAVLLSGLYLWTWNTESVLEMIEWMRYRRAPLRDWFDAIIHFESTRPTTLLPRRPPSTW